MDMLKKYYRQFNLREYGIADIVGAVYGICGEDIYISVDIIELKKDRIDFNTFEQALKYYRGIDLLIDKTLSNIDIDKKRRTVRKDMNIILIGTSIDTSSNFCFLSNIFPKVHLYTMSLDIEEGILFKYHEDYTIVDSNIGNIDLGRLVDFKSPI